MPCLSILSSSDFKINISTNSQISASSYISMFLGLTRKIFTRAAENYLFFFNRFSGNVLFSSLVSFALLCSCFFVFFCLWPNNCSESNYKSILVIHRLQPCICSMNILIWSRKRVNFRQNCKEQRWFKWFKWFQKIFQNFIVKDVNSDLCNCIILCKQVKK